VNAPFWVGQSVLVTGHTGFKGGWLTLWLQALGAHVHGYALDPDAAPSLLEVAAVSSLTASDTRADLADLSRLTSVFAAAQPRIVFHLAAQPLVLESYRNPLGTFRSNILGTAHVLEAARRTGSVRAMVVVTTDKVYAQRDGVDPCVEGDLLGGHDPYSASKAAAELLVASYRSSFFLSESALSARIATARAGNVIGGGDWAVDRLIPDCLRAFTNREPVRLRFPAAVRPWQHVLEPLSGYLRLAEHLAAPGGERYARAWNFGPDPTADATTGEVAQMAAHLWGESAQVVNEVSPASPHETAVLRLDSSRARSELGWRSRWSLNEALQRTVRWHRAWAQQADMAAVSLDQIRDYEATTAG
jgi:CDP-glucose 4,6-dehydratase